MSTDLIQKSSLRDLIAFLIVAVTLPGCSSLSTEPPLNYNLTGQWELNNALSDSPNLAVLGRASGRRNPDAGARTRSGGGGMGRGQGRGPKNGGGAGGQTRGGTRSGTLGGVQSPLVVQVLVATEMAIEQNEESMGVDYNGQHYRDVSWGERKRGQLTVNTGWDEDNLVIATEGGRFEIEETYILSDDGSRLTAVVELDGGKNDMVFTRVFEKVGVVMGG